MKRLIALAVFLFTVFLFPVMAGADDKVTVCHATGSATNPWVVITIDRAGWENGHSKHEGDFITTTGNCNESDKKAAPTKSPAATAKPVAPNVRTLPSTSTN